MAVTLGTLCLGIVLASVLGGMLPLATVLNHTRLQVYLSFSAGTMLGAAFFHMLPEAVRASSPATIPWAAVGLLMLFFLERFFSFHHHEPHEHGPETHSHDSHAQPAPAAPNPSSDCPLPVSTLDRSAPGTSHDRKPAARLAVESDGGALPWGSAAFGLAVHSLVGGVALASAVAADYQVRAGLGAAGVGVFVATLVHKPADALTITSLMVRAGSGRREAHLINLVFALMIPLGVILFAVGVAGAGANAVAAWTSGALAFSAGTFLCIALSDLLPELQFHSHDRLKLSIALLAGIAVMAGAAVVEKSERDPGAPAQAALAGPLQPVPR
jgi:zinc and cadmium transporter